jgi:hypothetical protein
MTKQHLLPKRGRPFAKTYRWFLPLALILVLVGLFAMNITHTTLKVHAATPSKTIWLQVMDSCKQALPGANFTLVAPDGTNVNAGPSAGTGRVTVSTGTCPLQRGNCLTVPTGCVSWLITPPTSGTATYTIQEKPTWDATDDFFENPPGATAFSGFVACNGGSACQKESATFTIDSNGVVSGTTTNIYPDGTTTTIPSGGTFSATQTDPIVFHNFQLGNGSCDGDRDKDDHLTGSPSSHCDNDKDPKSDPGATPTPSAPPPPDPGATPTPGAPPTSTANPTDPPGLPPTGSDPNK